MKMPQADKAGVREAS